MKKNQSDLLKQGEDLDALIEKSKDLSAHTKQFKNRAKKANSGCFGCFGCG